MRFVVLALTLFWTVAQASADQADRVAPAAITEQLRCDAAPNALPAIAFLAKRSLIDLTANVGGDSVSCFRLKRPYDLDGLTVTGICGATEDPLVHALWPDVFYRGPGTSPGILLSVATDMSANETAAWAASQGIPTAGVGESDWFEGLTEVECNSFTR